MKKLNDIAEIRMGYTFRGSLKQAAIGNTSAIQMKDATPEGLQQTDAFARVDLESLPEHYLLLPGDLIFRSRGMLNTTAVIEQPMPRTICIAPLMFIRIRHHSTVLPHYLQWFINLPATQKRLNSFARGTTIRMIPAEAMETLDIVLPSVERQRQIIEIADMDRQSRLLEAKLTEKRQLYIDESLLRFAKGIERP